MKSDGIIIAEIHVFQDGDWEYTGKTKVVNSGPEAWQHDDLASVIKWGIDLGYEQFEILGAFQYVYKKEETA